MVPNRSMKKIYNCFLTLLILLFLSEVVVGQQARTVSGIVLDEEKKPLPAAEVALFTVSDSNLVAGSFTDNKGAFFFKAKPGEYFLRISLLTFDNRFEKLSLRSEDLKLGILQLNPRSSSLDDVTIVAEKQLMELDLDKRVYNVGLDLSNRGANGLDIMQNIPSVEVDYDGNVSLRGSDNVRILVDGKQSGLAGINSNDALRQLQGDMIEKIEVITNPSARYDAEGDVGIINIVLKKQRRGGLNGSLDLTAGYPANYGAALNLNYKSKNYNLFGSYGFNLRRGPGSGTGYQEFTYPDTTYVYRQSSKRVRGGPGQNIRAGADFFLDKNNTLTISGLYSVRRGIHNSEIEYEDLDFVGEVSREVGRTEDETDRDVTREGNLNYERKLTGKDHKWTFDMKYSDNTEYEEAELNETSPDPDYASIAQRTFSNDDEFNWLFQTDYVRPIGKDGKFETGAKATLRRLENDYELQQLFGSEWITNGEFANAMIYTEDIYAAYVMAGNKTGKLSYQGGVRAEYSDIETELVATNESNPRDYLNFFPSANLSYEFKPGNFVQANYSYRISRPRHWWLMPFFSFADSRNFFSGNPNLNPEYTHSSELGYLRQWEKGNVLASVYYRKTTDAIQRVLLSDSLGFTRRFPINLGTEDNVGLEISGSQRFFKWWSVNGSMNSFWSVADGTYENVRYYAETFAIQGRLTSRWRIGKVNLQSSFTYHSPRKIQQGRELARYSWDAGASHDFWKGNATISLSARDILNSRFRRTVVIGDNFYAETKRQWRARQFLVSFNYRLNQAKRQGRSGGGFDGGGEF